MLTQWYRNCWLVAARGAVAVLFGAAALVWPGLNPAVLMLLFGAYALVDGLFAVSAAALHRLPDDLVWLPTLEGVVGIVAGLLACCWPAAAARDLLYLVAGWAAFTGIIEITLSVRLRATMGDEWVLVLDGILSVALGVILTLDPSSQAAAFSWLIEAYAIVFGVSMLVLSMRLHGAANKPARRLQHSAHAA